MAKAGVISDYLESLATALSFDRVLARSVREEVEDHLCEALAADRTGDRLEAERRAIANFGDPLAIAAQFAVVSLAQQTRRAGIAIILVIGGVFATMKARLAWYAMTEWAMRDDLRAVGATVGLVDRYAFRLSVVIGIAALITVAGRYATSRRQLRRSFLLCVAATALLVVSVISDGVLTALQLAGGDLCADSLVPLLSMTIEIACIGVLVFLVRAIALRTASTAALLNL